MKEYGRKTYISKSYTQMMKRVTDKQIFDQKLLKQSEMKKPYQSESYEAMEQYMPSIYGGSNYPIPWFDAPSYPPGTYEFPRFPDVPWISLGDPKSPLVPYVPQPVPSEPKPTPSIPLKHALYAVWYDYVGGGNRQVVVCTVDGITWTNSNILALTGLSDIFFMNVYKSKLYVLGKDSALKTLMYVFDGAKWSKLRDFGMGVYPISMTVGNYLYFAFLMYTGGYGGGEQRGYVYSYNGSSWANLLAASSDIVPTTLGIHNANLYVAGETRNTSPYIPVVYYWSGSVWINTSCPSSYFISSMASYSGKLYGIVDNKIAVYDGVSWTISTMTNFRGSSLAVYNGNLYASGYWGGGPG